MMKKLKGYHFLLLCLSLTGCTVFSNVTTWNCNNCFNSSLKVLDEPVIHITLTRKVSFYPTLPIMLQLERGRDYGFKIDFFTREEKYKQLDSLTYQITDTLGNVLTAGTSSILDGVIKEQTLDVTRYRSITRTPYFIEESFPKAQMKGKFTVFVTDINNKQQALETDFVALYKPKGTGLYSLF